MIAMGGRAIAIMAIAQPLWAGSMVCAGALRGTGNTRLPLLISAVATWSVVGIGALLVTQWWHSLTAMWIAFLGIAPLEVTSFWFAWRHATFVPALHGDEVVNYEL